MTEFPTRATVRTRKPRIVQITGLTDPTTGAPVLAALDDQGRVWVADASHPSVPGWQEVRPIPPDEPLEEPVKTASVDPTEQAGLLRELESLLYHAAKDLDYLAADIDAHIQRLGGGAETARAAVAADLIRLAGKAIRQASADLAGEVSDA